jgi:hypothetical protein
MFTPCEPLNKARKGGSCRNAIDERRDKKERKRKEGSW